MSLTFAHKGTSRVDSCIRGISERDSINLSRQVLRYWLLVNLRSIKWVKALKLRLPAHRHLIKTSLITLWKISTKAVKCKTRGVATTGSK